jgi:tetratricopeptide (TPR) repeat protein
MVKISTMFVALAIVTGAAALTTPAFAVGNENDESTASNPDYDSAVRAVKNEKYRDAIGYLKTVLADDPKNADALNFMGYSHRKLGDFTKAITYYTRALTVDPDHRGANEYLGEAYLEINDLANAELRLERLRAICGTGCEEYHELKSSVAGYKANRKPNQSSRRRW